MDTVLIKASALGFTNVMRYVLERASQVDEHGYCANQGFCSWIYQCHAIRVGEGFTSGRTSWIE